MNIWQEFAQKTNGTFKEGYSWNSDSTEIEYKNWKIIFDNYTLWSGKYSNELTRVIVPVKLQDNYRLEIYTEGLVRKIEKFFGAQDIEIGYPEFDHAFTIKSNNEFKTKSLLRDKNIRNLIQSQKEVNILISDQKGIWGEKLPDNEFELSYFIDDEIDNFETPYSLLELFKALLDELFQLNLIK